MKCSVCGVEIDRATQTYYTAAIGWRKNGKGAVLKPRTIENSVRCGPCHDGGFEQLSIFEELGVIS